MREHLLYLKAHRNRILVVSFLILTFCTALTVSSTGQGIIRPERLDKQFSRTAPEDRYVDLAISSNHPTSISFTTMEQVVSRVKQRSGVNLEVYEMIHIKDIPEETELQGLTVLALEDPKELLDYLNWSTFPDASAVLLYSNPADESVVDIELTDSSGELLRLDVPVRISRRNVSTYLPILGAYLSRISTTSILIVPAAVFDSHFTSFTMELIMGIPTSKRQEYLWSRQGKEAFYELVDMFRAEFLSRAAVKVSHSGSVEENIQSTQALGALVRVIVSSILLVGDMLGLLLFTSALAQQLPLLFSPKEVLTTRNARLRTRAAMTLTTLITSLALGTLTALVSSTGLLTLLSVMFEDLPPQNSMLPSILTTATIYLAQSTSYLWFRMRYPLEQERVQRLNRWASYAILLAFVGYRAVIEYEQVVLPYLAMGLSIFLLTSLSLLSRLVSRPISRVRRRSPQLAMFRALRAMSNQKIVVIALVVNLTFAVSLLSKEYSSTTLETDRWNNAGDFRGTAPGMPNGTVVSSLLDIDGVESVLPALLLEDYAFGVQAGSVRTKVNLLAFSYSAARSYFGPSNLDSWIEGGLNQRDHVLVSESFRDEGLIPGGTAKIYYNASGEIRNRQFQLSKAFKVFPMLTSPSDPDSQVLQNRRDWMIFPLEELSQVLEQVNSSVSTTYLIRTRGDQIPEFLHVEEQLHGLLDDVSGVDVEALGLLSHFTTVPTTLTFTAILVYGTMLLVTSPESAMIQRRLFALFALSQDVGRMRTRHRLLEFGYVLGGVLTILTLFSLVLKWVSMSIQNTYQLDSGKLQIDPTPVLGAIALTSGYLLLEQGRTKDFDPAKVLRNRE